MAHRCLFVLFAIAPFAIASADVDFNRDVRPILSDRCFACHGPDADNQDSDFRVDSFDNATADLGGYTGVAPGDLDASEMHARIHDADDPMPPADALKQLPVEDRKILDQWIMEGAKFDSHWAFKPLPKSVDIPPVKHPWNRGTPPTPIDRFIAAGHVANDLTPAGEAPREKWLRRVTFDLTGLPPTPQELKTFLNDDADDAREAIVDRLLASDACAERLTSEWLDVARYADSYGYQRDDPRYVWPYRDWVIDAFRKSMPYDQFITRQLAGDLLPDATEQQRLATTFNRLHSHKKEGGVAIEEFRVENVADRTHTVGAAFLGLTMECCRCHDHKYDPIPTKDYYALSAFFDNIGERGLISYFTDAVPTPAMSLPTDKQQARIDAATADVASQQEAYDKYLRDQADQRFSQWRQSIRVVDPLPGLVARLSFEAFDEASEFQAVDETNKKIAVDTMATIANATGSDAVTPRANRLTEGRFGNAIELTGDDAVVLPGTGHFARHDAFSTSLWIWTSDLENRGVIYRRSRGWDDAGSVGYELTKEKNVLSAKLCHFWPGDAIAVETVEPIEANRWIHVAVTYDGSSRADGLKIYLDGQPAETTVTANHLTRNITDWDNGYDDFAIGSRYRDRGFTAGRVDELHLFDREISSAEVRHLFDGKSLWSLLGGASADLRDEEKIDLQNYFLAAIDPFARERREALRNARTELNAAIDAAPAIMVMRENDVPRQTYLLKRGVYDSHGEPVAPATPGFLPPMPDDYPRDRLGLARWLTDPDHPLTARVTVNRYWQMMFGNGLVSTPEDFGNQGSVPTHPELLDWLARDFVNGGWSVQNLLKDIALSATYRQTSIVDADARRRDPENIHLARGTGQRLSAEMIRDNALATSGLLVNQVGGTPVKPYDVALAYTPMKVDDGDKLYRRSLYTFWKRTSPAPLMMTLNTPTREVCRLKREITNTPLQALVMLNGHQFIEAARVMAADLISLHGDDKNEIIADAFLRLTSRNPSDQESLILVQLHDEQLADFDADAGRTDELLDVGNSATPENVPKPQLAAVTVLVNTIMNFDESVRHQ